MEERKNQIVLIPFLIHLFLIFNGRSRSTASASQLPQASTCSKHFVLVHGACHGGWSWYNIVALLRSSGHNVTALDLAASGINPKQVEDVPFISDYIRPLTDFMAALPADERVVLVGHSFGGFAISKAMESFPEKIEVAVFVNAAMIAITIPDFSRQVLKRLESLIEKFVMPPHASSEIPNTINYDEQYLATEMYQLSPIEDLALATTLLRPLRSYSVLDILQEMIFTKENYGSVKRVYIRGDEDKLTEWYEIMLAFNQPNEVRIISGGDHMVMMSKPLELGIQLQNIAEKYSNNTDSPPRIQFNADRTSEHVTMERSLEIHTPAKHDGFI